MAWMKWTAFNDLTERYRTIFRYAWAHRREMAPVARLPHEAQFLPAALSLQETPVSPAPRVAMWLIIAFMLIALTWAIFGRVDVVAAATGKIVPSGRTKTIQSIETATVKAIHVIDGQAVRQGDVLIELDTTATAADVQRLRHELATARLSAARARAMLAVIDQPDMAAVLEHPVGVDDQQLAQARQQLASQVGEYRARLARSDAEEVRRRAELESTRALAGKLAQTAPLARQRARDFQQLAEQNFVSRHGYLEREQSRIEQEADLANLRGRLREIEAGLSETRSQRAALIAEMRRTTFDTLTEGIQRSATLEQELLKADKRDALTQLISPVDGTVQQLAVHTVGGVVTPAQPLMLVVPRDHVLEAETFLENKDIGFVKVGQTAQVKVETFPYTKYGTIPATVTSVSHDAINDEKRGLIYAAHIRLERAFVDVDGAEVALTPGMAVSAEVKTGKRRVIEYFLSPLMTRTSESLRER